MTDMGTHSESRARKDRLLPALFLIVTCGLLEVWASWLTIGSVSGFPKLGSMTTGWILPVTTEAYWTAALLAWLVDPAGPKSRRFAMWTAGAVFLLSLIGQESAHLVAAARSAPPAFAVGLVTALPLIAVALGTVLIHFRQADRDDSAAAERARLEAAEQAAIERAEADERTALREQVDALTGQLAASESAHGGAEDRIAKADARIAQLERKLAAQPGAKGARKQGANAGRKDRAEEDVDARTKALGILSREPDISGAELGLSVGMSKRWGQIHRDELAGMAAEFAGDGDVRNE